MPTCSTGSKAVTKGRKPASGYTWRLALRYRRRGGVGWHGGGPQRHRVRQWKQHALVAQNAGCESGPGRGSRFEGIDAFQYQLCGLPCNRYEGCHGVGREPGLSGFERYRPAHESVSRSGHCWKPGGEECLLFSTFPRKTAMRSSISF